MKRISGTLIKLVRVATARGPDGVVVLVLIIAFVCIVTGSTPVIYATAILTALLIILILVARLAKPK
jgi:hypothetical protein